MVKKFDPVGDEIDFRDLESLAKREFRRHLQSLHIDEIPDASLSSETGRTQGGGRFIVLSGEIDPGSAVANPEFAMIGAQLAGRELAVRLRGRFGTLPGGARSFGELWEAAAAAHGGDWPEIVRELSAEPLSTVFRATARIAIEPLNPPGKRLLVDFSYSIDSPFLSPAENATGSLAPFGDWLAALE